MATLKVSICIMTATVFILTVTEGQTGCQASTDIDWEDIKATVIKKHVGEAVQIQCSYPFNYDKDDNFLCKGDNPVSCNRMRHKTKVLRVNERKKHFSVRIHDLSKTDSGTYWCSSNTTWKQSEYAKVQLHVDEDTKSRKSSHPTVHVTVATVTMTPQLSMLSSATTPSTHSVVKGGSSVQGAHNATNNEGDPAVHLYEEVQMQSLSGHAIVSPPADLVHYSSVSFLQDSSSILTAQTLHPETEENSSSSSIGGIQFSIPPVENMIYSTVKKPMGL
ncbi:uncharacterized protein LOC133476304 isoform X3 [Phyllopteryx taeniolatus]|uniref:uncharacterized protein LOC133476304 isoform X3 n=1 Tax=Phyllopteryx taeniolatus TaxID=161469 RepID=UPI002AD4E6C3|nr:uncharacterized protein LOC133476304 isoform X3 [Phyllopteryx taeniolatus]